MTDVETKLKGKRADSETKAKQDIKERERLRRMITGYSRQQISLYEKYKTGELTKESYLGRKAELKNVQSETEENLAKIEKRLEVSEIRSEGVPELPVTRYKDIRKYDKRIMASLIEKAEVYGLDVLQVTWKHQDEYERLSKLTS